MSKWFKGLNPEQKDAVAHTKGPLLILAGAGSGKTTVLVSRSGRLISEEGVAPDGLCVLTFTNKAAKELKSRVTAKLGVEAQKIWTGTFHSFGLQWMRAHSKVLKLPNGFGVIDGSDAEGIVREILKEVKIHSKDAFRIDTLLEKMAQLREASALRGLTVDRLTVNEADEYDVMAVALLPKYLRKLQLLGVCDFTDLLIRPLELVRQDPKLAEPFQNRFSQLMVDEFQDTNGIQLELVRELAKGSGNITVVGDDDQSIYGWRGARVANILEFPKEFPGAKVVRLERNYRSSPRILELANEVIAKNTERHGKTLRSHRFDSDHLKDDLGDLPEFFEYETEDSEVEETCHRIREFADKGVPHHETAILYRSNSQGGLLEGELRRENIPYQITGGQGFFERKEVKDALAYLRCSLSPNEVAYRRIINTPSRGIGETSIDKLTEWSEKNGVRFHIAARKAANVGLPDKAQEALTTLHLLLDHLPERILKRQPSSGVSELKGDSPGARLISFLREIGYRDLVLSLHKSTEAFEKRWVAIEVLAKVLDSFLSHAEGELTEAELVKFIDRMELRDAVDDSETDEKGKPKESKVQLLTLHACKGLEFDAVCLLGCEEDILPHRTLGGDIAEERRLFYVGVTRARKHLVLSRAKTRRRYGRLQPTTVSRFILEIPEKLIVKFDGSRPLAKTERKGKLADLFAKLDARVAQIAATPEGSAVE